MIQLLNVFVEGKLPNADIDRIADSDVLDGLFGGYNYYGTVTRQVVEDLRTTIGENVLVNGTTVLVTDSSLDQYIGTVCTIYLAPTGMYGETADQWRTALKACCSSLVSTATNPQAGAAPGTTLPGMTVRGTLTIRPNADADCATFAYVTSSRLVVTTNTPTARNNAPLNVIRDPVVGYDLSDTSSAYWSADPAYVRDHEAGTRAVINVPGKGACSHSVITNKNDEVLSYGALLEILGSEYRGTFPPFNGRTILHRHEVNGKYYLTSKPAPAAEITDPQPSIAQYCTDDFIGLMTDDGDILVYDTQVTDPVEPPPIVIEPPQVVEPPEMVCNP